MPVEPSTPGPVERIRSLVEPTNRRDFHAMVSLYAPDAVHDASPWAMGTYEGPAAIGRLFEDWVGAYEEFEIELEEVTDLGGGVLLVVLRQSCRPFGRRDHRRLWAAWVYEWGDGMVVRVTAYPDIDEARAAAERLAEERGWAMSQQNVELIKRLQPRPGQDLVALFRNDEMQAAWVQLATPVFHRDVECAVHVIDAPAVADVGLDGMRRAWLEWLAPWVSYRSTLNQLIDANDRVVALVRDYGRRVADGPEVEMIAAAVWTVREGKVARIDFYADRAAALEAVGLTR